MLLSGLSLAFWGDIIWAKSVFYKTLFVKTKTIKWRFQHFCYEKHCARILEVLLSGPSWPFLSCGHLGRDNSTYLAQIITPQNGIFVFLVCWNTYFQSVFLTSTKIGPQMGKTNDNFSHFAKHRFIKKPFCCNPPFDQKLVFFNFDFLKPKTLMLEKKNLKSGKNKDQKTGFKRKNKTGNPKKRKYLRKTIAIQFCDVVLFMKQKQRRKKRKKKEKQETKRKQKRKTRREKKKEQERERERERER